MNTTAGLIYHKRGLLSPARQKNLRQETVFESCPVPTSAVVNIEGRCNSRCLYCPSWRSANPPEISGERWKDIFDQLWDLGVKELVLSGGEPLLRKDIPELVAYASDLGFTVSLLTNGILLTNRLASLLAESGLDYLNLSLDSLDKDTYLRLRGVPLTRLVSAIEAVRYLASRPLHLQCAFTCVVTMLNLGEIPSFIKWANAQGIAVMLQPYHYVPGFKVPELLPTADNIDRLAELMKEVISMQATGFEVWNSEHYLNSIPSFMLDRELIGGSPCLAAYRGVNIDVNLDVRPCWYLPPVGNLNRASLDHIWCSEEFQAARQRMRRLECPRCMLLCHDKGLGETLETQWAVGTRALLSKNSAQRPESRRK